MKMTARIVALVVVVALVMPLSYAKEKKYRFELFAGGNFPGTKNFTISYPQTASPLKGSQEFSPGFQGGARIGIDTHKYWGMDYVYSFGINTGKIVTPYGQFSFNNRFHQAHADVLFYPWSLDRKQFYPYLIAGVGATFANTTQNAIEEALDPARAGIGPLTNEIFFAFNAGAGARVRLSERYGIRFDVRDYMSKPVRYGIPKTSNDPNAAVLPTSGVFHQLAATFALVIHF